MIVLQLVLALGMLLPAETRIVGGQEAATRDFPALVAVVLHADPDAHRGLICGGSLLSPRVVLTAAHCVVGSRAKEFDIVHRRRDLRTKKGERVQTQRLRVHPEYRRFSEDRDLALLETRRALPGPYLSPQKKVPEGVSLRVAGWGWSGKRYPYILHQAKVHKKSDAECKAEFGSLFLGSMFCADGQGEACSKDSGGPSLRGRNLYGVVSWGDVDCANSPTVYARIDLPWIERVLRRWKETR